MDGQTVPKYDSTRWNHIACVESLFGGPKKSTYNVIKLELTQCSVVIKYFHVSKCHFIAF